MANLTRDIGILAYNKAIKETDRLNLFPFGSEMLGLAATLALISVRLVSANPLDRNLAYRSPFIDKPHVNTDLLIILARKLI